MQNIVLCSASFPCMGPMDTLIPPYETSFFVFFGVCFVRLRHSEFWITYGSYFIFNICGYGVFCEAQTLIFSMFFFIYFFAS